MPGGWGGGGAPALPQIARRLQGPLIVRSWISASLFGGDPGCSASAARHRRKMQAVTTIADGADVLLHQESRGTTRDLVVLMDRLLVWLFLGSFMRRGTAGE